MQPSDEVHVERPRRQSALPAHLQDYDSTGYNLPRPTTSYSQKFSCAASAQEDVRTDTPQAAAYHGDYHSPQQWYTTDRWDQHVEALREENADLRKLHSDLITTVRQLKEERDDLKQANTKFSSHDSITSRGETIVKLAKSAATTSSDFISTPCTWSVKDPKPVPAPRRPRLTEPVSNPNYTLASHDTLQDGSSTDSVESSECSSSQSLSSTVDGMRNLRLSSSRHQKDNTSPPRQSRRRDVSHVRSPSSQSSSRPRLKLSF